MARTGTRRRGQGQRPWWSRRPPLWATLALVAVVALGTWLLSRPSSMERRVAELQAESDARDQEVGTQLIDVSLATVSEVQAVLDDTHAALPDVDGDGSIEQPASQADIEAWRESVGQVVSDIDGVGSAGSAVNVARNGLVGAGEQLQVVLDLYEVALDLPPDQASELLSATAAARQAAADAWNTAAIQLDVVSIEMGRGHSHVYVSGVPGEPLPDHGED